MSIEHETQLNDLNGTDLTPEERARAEKQHLRVSRELAEEKQRRDESQLARLRNRAGGPRHPATPSSDVMLTEKFVVKDIADSEKVSYKVLVSCLHDYTVDEVTASLEAIIADKSVKKKVRRQAVSRVVDNQPHPTKHFETFKSWIPELRDEAGFQTNMVMAWSVMSFTAFGLGIIGVSIEGFVPAALLPSIALLFMFGSIIFVMNKKAERKLPEIRHKRHNRALGEPVQEGVPELISRNSTVSISQTRQDFADAKARIASYETDMTKSLARPAFNDITVKEVGEMVAQLRKCSLLFADGADTVSATELADEVSQLWVNINVAEKVAKKLAWSQVSEREQELLKRALDLATHANAEGNTDAMRANYYRKLKEVVEQLNEHDDIVPKLVVDEIGFEVRKQIEPVRTPDDTVSVASVVGTQYEPTN